MSTTSAISGKDGNVTIGTSVAEVTNWNANLVSDALEATSFDSSGWREFVAGLSSGTGSFATVKGDIAIGAKASAVFSITGGPSISGAIIITSKTYTDAVEGIFTYEYDFTFTGPITS